MIATESFKFKFFYFIRFFGDAIFYPFMTIYFISKGMTEDKLGIILAISPIAAIIANPMWNYLVKDSKISRIVLQYMTVVEGILIILITRVTGFELTALIIALIAFFCSPYISIQDGFTATFCNKNGLEYTNYRIWASISYVIATLIAGYLVGYVGYEILFLISGLFFIVTALITVWIKPIDAPTTAITERPKRDLKGLLRNADFYKYLIFYTLVMGSVRIGDAFFGVYITSDLGLSTIGFGWVFSAFVLVEVIFMRLTALKGNNYSEKQLMIFASVLFMLRFLIYFLNPSLPIIILVTLLRGVSWGVVLYVHIKIIVRIVKLENVTSAILIITLVFSIFTGVGNFLTGLFVKNFGYQWFFLTLTAMIALGLISFLVFTPKLRPSDAVKLSH